MKLDVPFVSQYEVPRDSDGLGRACGIACVKMVIDYMGGKTETLSGLLEESSMIRGAYVPPVGWTNMGITALLRNHHISCYSEEFRSVLNDTHTHQILPNPFESQLIEHGIRKIAQEIERARPVIVSGIKNWTDQKSQHKMLIVGVEKNTDKITGFYYHDPDDEHKDGKYNFVPLEIFRNHWRKFAIFVSTE